MSYENICARRAVDRWILKPPKKNKLHRTNQRREFTLRQFRFHSQEGNPSQVLDQGSEQLAVPKSILQKGETHVAQGRKHDHTGKEDLEAVQIELVQLRCQA